MLGDDQRGWLGQVEHLAGAVAGAHGRRYRQPAGRARRRIMIDRQLHDAVGVYENPERAFVDQKAPTVDYRRCAAG